MAADLKRRRGEATTASHQASTPAAEPTGAKPAALPQMAVKFAVDETFSQEAGTGPYLAYFPNLQSGSAAKHCVYDAAYAQTTDAQGSFWEQRHRLSAQAGAITFVADSHEDQVDDASAASAFRHVIGIYDKATGVVTLREAPTVTFRTALAADARATAAAETAYAVKSMATRNALGQEFGTRKRQKALETTERNRITTAPVANATHVDAAEALDAAVASQDRQREAEREREAALREHGVGIDADGGVDHDTVSLLAVLPPRDPHADTPAGVYQLGDLITGDEWNGLDVQPLLELADTEPATITAALAPLTPTAGLVGRFRDCLEESRDPDRLRVLLYLGYLMRMLTMRLGLISPKVLATTLGATSEPLVAMLRQRFTEKQVARGAEHQGMTEHTRQKLLFHLMTLILILDDFQVDLSKLAGELKLPQNKVGLLCRTLGCTLDRVRGTRMAVLKRRPRAYLPHTPTRQHPTPPARRYSSPPPPSRHPEAAPSSLVAPTPPVATSISDLCGTSPRRQDLREAARGAGFRMVAPALVGHPGSAMPAATAGMPGTSQPAPPAAAMSASITPAATVGSMPTASMPPAAASPSAVLAAAGPREGLFRRWIPQPGMATQSAQPLTGEHAVKLLLMVAQAAATAPPTAPPLFEAVLVDQPVDQTMFVFESDPKEPAIPHDGYGWLDDEMHLVSRHGGRELEIWTHVSGFAAGERLTSM
ncbi:hypothetical protein CXG81DRAFT_19683 [Caulochytrium protostelioides]|uniref:RNA polymerase I associated factor, A49-like protein n=1 Tax=Caulochytrium protostelioides TaxID=1555241 RepID=A0A4P9X5R8_9FUNG|nr:hypothetical protein CXG81DRAFT_19683 [Caulochytrium protostelioides]|eukprot:RKP00350.1 hypothetical protein CXG81DRAFT_19683 [Caulochytrium protostelioides]